MYRIPKRKNDGKNGQSDDNNRVSKEFDLGDGLIKAVHGLAHQIGRSQNKHCCENDANEPENQLFRVFLQVGRQAVEEKSHCFFDTNTAISLIVY